MSHTALGARGLRNLSEGKGELRSRIWSGGTRPLCERSNVSRMDFDGIYASTYTRHIGTRYGPMEHLTMSTCIVWSILSLISLICNPSAHGTREWEHKWEHTNGDEQTSLATPPAAVTLFFKHWDCTRYIVHIHIAGCYQSFSEFRVQLYTIFKLILKLEAVW